MSDSLRISGSIRRRLTIQLVGSAAVLATLLFLIVQTFTRDLAEETHDRILLASATSIMDAISVRAGEVTVDLPYAALSMLSNVSDDRVFYRVMLGAETLTGYDDLPVPEPGSRETGARFDTLVYKGETVRMATTVRWLSRNGVSTPLIISVAQTRTGQTERLAALTRTALLLGAGFFAVAVLLAVWTAQSSIRPLRQLAGMVSRRGPTDLRPVARPVPAEMAPLVRSLNSFIDRLGLSLSRSEDFIAEAAHRVRTPLATVRTQAENTLHRIERPENRTALREMIRAIDESSRAAGQLLDHAMVSFRTDSLERKPFDLAELTAELVNRLRPVADLKDIDLELEMTGAHAMAGDPILVQNAVRNLLDNAIKYAPEETRITVSVRGDAAAHTLCIRDAAGGFPEDEMGSLTERFVRGRNAEGTVGSGLGLTIAREVAEAHGGRLEIANTKDGTGACVCLHFPSA
ncbi:sensor histidine kinase [Ruegeria sp. 1NDH52C]|uniref:histidine kinase n=1 Tax=Ruegeria alba TaxID=2916756 RepID=A0ABS9NYS8_9RHOB|nr:sensor histidine kinase [Ruegeria alba]MCG6559379.1 sensor histidine kinase [Ruegeria alba]